MRGSRRAEPRQPLLDARVQPCCDRRRLRHLFARLGETHLRPHAERESLVLSEVAIPHPPVFPAVRHHQQEEPSFVGEPYMPSRGRAFLSLLAVNWLGQVFAASLGYLLASDINLTHINLVGEYDKVGGAAGLQHTHLIEPNKFGRIG